MAHSDSATVCSDSVLGTIRIRSVTRQFDPLSPGTKDAVVAAFRGGADGVLISRKYSEIKLGNLKAVGAAIQELGLA